VVPEPAKQGTSLRFDLFSIHNAVKVENSDMYRILFAAAFAMSCGLAVAQESGLPTQSGGQEPEVPGNSSGNASKPVVPNTDSRPKAKSSEEKQKALKQEKCKPGKDAKECREHGVKRK